MVTKTRKSPRKTVAQKVRDLPARKNPKGGAQKKESQGTGSGATSTLGLRRNKTQLA